jgi:hypothetical protein
MKAISLWQPWASAIACGAKRIETRSWETRYFGPIAIHAAKKWDHELAAIYCRLHDEVPGFSDLLKDEHDRYIPLPFGAVIATAELLACVPTDQLRDNPKVGPMELALGNYSPGRFGWLLQNVVRLPKPIPARGHQQLWEWNEVPA